MFNNKKEKMELMRPEMVNPFRMMRSFTKDMERMFENFPGFGFPKFFETGFTPFRPDFEKVEWLPQLEVMFNKDQFIVRADLPGLTKDDVKVEITPEFLTISGERKEKKEEKHEGFFTTEFNYGTFFRQIPLPEGTKTDIASATFNNGVLEITMPAVQPTTSTRKLEIKEPGAVKVAKATA